MEKSRQNGGRHHAATWLAVIAEVRIEIGALIYYQTELIMKCSKLHSIANKIFTN